MKNFLPQELILCEKSHLSSTYVETFVYEPAQVNELALGQLYIAAEISSNKTKKESAKFLTELTNVLKNEYYRRTNLAALTALKFTLKKANNFLEQIPSAEKEKIIILNMVIGSLIDEKLHLAKIGSADTLIIRQENIYNVFPVPALKIKNQRESFQAKADSINLKFENITSGQLEKKDTIFLSSQKLTPADFEGLKNYLNAHLASRPKNLAALNLHLKNLAAIILRPNSLKTEHVLESATLPATLSHKTKNKIYKTSINYMAQKKTVIILSLIALAAGLTIFSALTLKKEAAAKKQEAETLLQEITGLKEKIAVVIELGNDNEANNILIQAQSKMERLRQLNYFKTTAASLNEEIDKISQQLSHAEKIATINKVLSLENNSLNFNPQALSLGQNKIFVLGENNFYQFDTNRKEGNFDDAASNYLDNKIIALLENPKESSQIFLAGENKLINFSLSSQTIQELWQKPDQISLLKQVILYNETFYILTTGNLIYKLSGQKLFKKNTATSSPDANLSLWLDKNETAEPLSQITIDGYVYALAGRNKVLRLLNGVTRETFNFNENIDQIFTESSFNNLYLLSRDSGMLIVFEKDKKTIKKRLDHPELKSAKSFYVNSQEKVIYFLKDKTVYSFEI